MNNTKAILKSLSEQNLQEIKKLNPNPEMICGASGQKLLHLAAKQSSPEIFSYFLEHSNIELTDSIGRTPLHYAASYGQGENVKLLIQRGANVNSQTIGGDTPLFKSIQYPEGEQMFKCKIPLGRVLNKFYNKSEKKLLIQLMYRDIPISNKICATKEIFQNQLILNNHVLTMRPQIDTSAPKQYEFLKNQKIKEAIKQQKQQEIDRENRNLISKITNIMQQQSNNSISSLPLKRSESSNVNNQQKKSLNKDHRKKELIKIVMENQQLLKRIQDQKSQYNVKSWNEERKWVEKYIANISDYPYKDFKPTKTLVQYWTNTRISESQLQKREQTANRKLDPIKSQQSKYRPKEQNNYQQEQQQSLFASDYQPYEPIPQDQLVFQDQKEITKENNTQDEEPKVEPEIVEQKLEQEQEQEEQSQVKNDKSMNEQQDQGIQAGGDESLQNEQQVE